jgi:hypothetical protein
MSSRVKVTFFTIAREYYHTVTGQAKKNGRAEALPFATAMK